MKTTEENNMQQRECARQGPGGGYRPVVLRLVQSRFLWYAEDGRCVLRGFMETANVKASKQAGAKCEESVCHRVAYFRGVGTAAHS